MSTEQPIPAPQIGTDAEQAVHRDPAPTVAEHNEAFQQSHPDDVVGRQQ
jgi:hypothetical protein